MKKIAILRCLKKSAACAGVSCINAFYDREKTFEQYGDEEMRLMSVWTCNGCGASMLENQEGINKKIAKMQAIGVDVVHLSNCTRKKDENGEKHLCPTIKRIEAELEAAGITVVEGTH